ncbi:RNA binding protein [Geomicrobium sp. JCM 19037]|uniref:ribosome assembly RNA-binding protein YhbY n=1 Tax=unclassified Geomicrobium TaxID=2628951 RepID=UPI00045F4439|nr:ribosome assembly RNA-binding protein YhbY [Geomicrobium sp. JCM 19037]GAK04144.1 RNA binding protein [Geomicrobium sp. JCM 19037]
MQLKNKQLKYLRSEANAIKPILQVGKAGVNPNLISQIKDALEARELIKVSVLQNCPEDKDVVANKLAERSGAHLVQVIGFTIVLYRPSTENPRIELP